MCPTFKLRQLYNNTTSSPAKSFYFEKQNEICNTTSQILVPWNHSTRVSSRCFNVASVFNSCSFPLNHCLCNLRSSLVTKALLMDFGGGAARCHGAFSAFCKHYLLQHIILLVTAGGIISSHYVLDFFSYFEVLMSLVGRNTCKWILRKRLAAKYHCTCQPSFLVFCCGCEAISAGIQSCWRPLLEPYVPQLRALYLCWQMQELCTV